MSRTCWLCAVTSGRSGARGGSPRLLRRDLLVNVTERVRPCQWRLLEPFQVFLVKARLHELTCGLTKHLLVDANPLRHPRRLVVQPFFAGARAIVRLVGPRRPLLELEVPFLFRRSIRGRLLGKAAKSTRSARAPTISTRAVTITVATFTFSLAITTATITTAVVATVTAKTITAWW